MQGVDAGTYYFFRGHADQLAGLRGLMQMLDWLGNPWVSALILAGLLATLLVRGRTRGAILVLFSTVAGIAVVEGLRWGLHAAGVGARPPEPDAAYAAVAGSPGFPSQSAFLAALAFGLLAVVAGHFCRSWKACLAVYAACVLVVLLHGFSQLFLRVHFLTDLLGAWTAAVLCLLACHHWGFAGR
jgi:undecaprenyl-diphosphatase